MSCLRRFFQWILIIGCIGFSTPSFSRISSLFSLNNSLGFSCLRAFSKEYQREKLLLEWGEARLERPFTDEEAKTFLRVQSYFLPTQRKREILADAGFSPPERKKLIKAIPLIEPSKEIKIQIPEKTNEEQALKAQGFNSAYTRGIDEANEWIAVARQIRAEMVDPYRTHFDYFAGKTLKHIQDIDEEVEDPQQRRKLLRWKRYVERKRQKGSFTYEDLLRVNWALSKILKNGTEDGLEYIERLIYAFPRVIAMPTTTGAVGIMTLNRAGTHGLHTIGLKYDSGYFYHDLSHAVHSNEYYPPLWFYENMNRLSKKLPTQKRKNIELSYWLLTHENMKGDWFSLTIIMKRVLRTCCFYSHLRDELKGVIDTSSEEKIRQQMKEAIKDFTEIFVLAKRRAVWL